MTVDGRPATFTRDGQELRHADEAAAAKERFNVAVRLRRHPGDDRGLADRVRLAVRLRSTPRTERSSADEPNAASTWIPISDHPSDKATWTFRVDGAAGLNVIVQRRGCAAERHAHGKSHLRVERALPDGELPRRPPTRQLGHATGSHAGGIPDRRWPSTRAARRQRPERGRLLLRHHGRGDRPLEPDVRPATRSTRPARSPTTPTTTARRSASRSRRRRGPVYSTVRSDLDDRARAGTPVVRRQRLAGDVAAHLAQRGLRDLRAVPVGRAQGRQHAPISRSWTTTPGRTPRPFWHDHGGRPAARHDVRQRRLSPRRR